MDALDIRLHQVRLEWGTAFERSTDLASLEKERIAFLGKKGLFAAFFEEFKAFSVEEKKVHGPLLQQEKQACEARYLSRKAEIESEIEARGVKKLDVTAYTPLRERGSLHPYSHIIEEIENIFISLGFSVFDGPEVETDYNNFTALNIPADHPARDMYDTFWLTTPGKLLRTHTSSVQARAMRAHGVPLAGISTGRVYRHEAVDASHDCMFMQCEGIVIDKGITLGHLFGVVQRFLAELFGNETIEIRTRPGFFPFVEPGVEIDMRCPFCTTGCSTCKKSTWIEVFPGGMIHPNVLREAGIDPEVYSGFAFGFGLTRLAMLRFGIRDIRMIHSGKIAFLENMDHIPVASSRDA